MGHTSSDSHKGRTSDTWLWSASAQKLSQTIQLWWTDIKARLRRVLHVSCWWELHKCTTCEQPGIYTIESVLQLNATCGHWSAEELCCHDLTSAFTLCATERLKTKKMSVKSNQWLKKTGLRATQTSSVLSVSELWCCQLHHQCPLSHCYPPSLLICPKTSTLLLWLHLEPLQNQLYFKDTSVSSALPPPSSIPPTFRQWRFHLCFCWPQGLEHIPLCFLCFLQLYSFTCVTPSPALFFLCDLSHHQPKTAVLQSLHYEPPMSHNSLYGHNFLCIKGVDSPHTDIATVKLGLASTYLKCSLFIIRGNIVLHINY